MQYYAIAPEIGVISRAAQMQHKVKGKASVTSPGAKQSVLRVGSQGLAPSTLLEVTMQNTMRRCIGSTKFKLVWNRSHKHEHGICPIKPVRFVLRLYHVQFERSVGALR